MGIDFVRNNNTKRPPLLLIGLIIILFILICCWWSLSSRNLELLKQIDNLTEQLKINGEELNKCFQQKQFLDEKLKDSQTRFVQQEIRMDQMKAAEEEVRQGYSRIETELKESQMRDKSLHENLETFNSQMSFLTKFLEKLQSRKDFLMETSDKATNEEINSGDVKDDPGLVTNDAHGDLSTLSQAKTKKNNDDDDDERKARDEKEEEYSKNDGDSGLPPLESDLRELEMKV